MLNPRELRHDLHQNPELSLEEFRTTEVIRKNIQNMFATYGKNYSILAPLETGLIIDYNPVDLGEYILLRADIDALPIKEKTAAKFKSKNDNMHACGHDVHTAILYGTLEYILKHDIQQNILFLFQPAEEESGGAKRIINSGILDRYKITRAHALHVNDEYDAGDVAFRPNVLFASSLEIDIEFTGKSTHVANTEQGKNALLALAQVLQSCDELSKNTSEKIILGFGVAHSGTARNIIPGKATLKGTLRTPSMNMAKDYFQSIENILQQVKESSGVDYHIQKGAQYKEVTNAPALYEKAKYALAHKFSFINCEMKMTAEDFGYFSDLYPSLMLWLGTRKHGEPTGLHSPYFLPDDDIIELGIEVYKVLLRL